MKCVVNGRMAKAAKIESVLTKNNERVKLASFTLFTPDPNGPKKEVLDEKTGEVRVYNQGVALACRCWGENAEKIENLKAGDIVTGAATVRHGKDVPQFVITKIDPENKIHKQMSELITAYTSGEIEQIYDMGEMTPSFQMNNDKALEESKENTKEDVKESSMESEYEVE